MDRMSTEEYGGERRSVRMSLLFMKGACKRESRYWEISCGGSLHQEVCGQGVASTKNSGSSTRVSLSRTTLIRGSTGARSSTRDQRRLDESGTGPAGRDQLRGLICR